jgi:hypothetical protein
MTGVGGSGGNFSTLVEESAVGDVGGTPWVVIASDGAAIVATGSEPTDEKRAEEVDVEE